MKPLEPGSTIGIVGGGQLGRMLCAAAAKLGFRTLILDPDANCPAAKVSAGLLCAPYDDAEALATLAEQTSAITYEFENIPATTAQILSDRGANLAPNARALGLSQDRVTEKKFLNDIGIETAPYRKVDQPEDLAEALQFIGTPAILKTRRLGYDGKGQVVVKAGDDPKAAFASLQSVPCILEGFVDFSCEISVIAARDVAGHTQTYHPARNEHHGGILRTSTVPSGMSETLIAQAREKAITLLTELDYVGVLGLEFFVTREDHLLANEFAPRVHNSGHWTVEACGVSQFENHIRAIAGWPLGSAARHSNCVMENLIGEDASNWAAIAQDPAALLTLYGKHHCRPGRKMGHVTRLAPRQAEPAPQFPE